MIDLNSAPIEALCDGLETLALAISPKPLSNAAAISFAADHFNVNDLKVNRAFQKLGKRKELLGEKYPFEVSTEYIRTRDGFRFSIYSVLLSLSAPSPLRGLAAWNLPTAAKILERLVEKCFTGFYGDGTKSVNFGFPSEVQRPSEFGEAVIWLSQRTGIPVGSGYRPARYKDGGVDIFVWKDFGDHNPGVPLLLLQCTIQEKFIEKIGDVDRRLWASWLSSDIDPIVGLCVPHVVSDNKIWSEVTTRGLLFDRIRLLSMVAENASVLPATEEAYVQHLLSQLLDQVS